jgi:outer membrane immunogenic protein
VLGFEGDVQSSAQRSATSCLTYCGRAQYERISQSLPWLATLRGRLGLAAGPVLFYGTAGAAIAGIKTEYATTNRGDFAGAASVSKIGLAIGAGIEAQLFGNWTAKVEYLHLHLGDANTTFIYPRSFGNANATSPVTTDVRDHIARIGLNYRFGDAQAPFSSSAASMLTAAAPMFAGATYDWTGFYVGVNAGYGVGRNASSQTTFGIFGGGRTEELTLVPHGLIGGGQAGLNFQLGNLVAGVEADYQFSDRTDAPIFDNLPTILFSTIEQNMSRFATVRGRLGYAAGPAIFYATGGWAATEVKTDNLLVNVNTGRSFGSVSNKLSGWVIGGGIEAALAANWSAKLEYLYMDYGAFTNAYPATPALSNLADPNLYVTSHVRDSIFRVGLNYRFGAAPLVARY